MPGQAIVLGVGVSNGLGAAIARKFAHHGLDVVVSGRTKAKIEDVTREIITAGGTARAVICDVTDEAEVTALFKNASEDGAIDAVIYNAGNNAIIPFADLDAKMFEDFWRVCCFGGFLTAQAAMPILLEQGEGSLIFTGASGSLRGKSNFAHFAAAKAALRMLSQSLAREYGPQGIHVAHVVVDGVIDGAQVRSRFADYLEHLGPGGSLNPDEMAEAYWVLHTQPRSAWTQELDIRPYKESW